MSFLDRFNRVAQDRRALKIADEPPAVAVPAVAVPWPWPVPAPPEPKVKHEILLDLGDFLPRIPKQLLHGGPYEAHSKLKFDIAELADCIGRGATTIPLMQIHRRAPEIFREEILASDETEVRFPWQKVMRMLADARTAPGAEGLTPGAADSLAERLRGQRTIRNIVPDIEEACCVPHPAPAPVSAPKVLRDAPPAPPAVAPAIPDMRIVADDGALALSLNTGGTTLNSPLQDDDKPSREELLRSREAMRAQLARMKGEFGRQLAAAAQERQKIVGERERFVAEMMRAKAAADDRIEQIAFEKSVAAKTAENLTKAQQAAKALQRNLSALKAEMAMANEEADRRINELTAERDALAPQQAVSSSQTAEFPNRGQPGRTMTGEAALAGNAASASVEDLREIDEPKSAFATLQFQQPKAALELSREKKAKIKLERRRVTSGRLNLRFARHVLATLAFAAVFAGGLAAWYLKLSKRDGAVSADVRQLEREWAGVSASLDEARRVRPHLQGFLHAATRARAEFDGEDRWTPALRSIEASAKAGIALRAIRVVKKIGDPRASMVRIEGFAMGTAPRATADRFLKTLQGELGRHFQIAEPCRFERLEDEPEPPSALPDQRRAIFTITAPIGSAIPRNDEGANPKT